MITTIVPDLALAIKFSNKIETSISLLEVMGKHSTILPIVRFPRALQQNSALQGLL